MEEMGRAGVEAAASPEHFLVSMAEVVFAPAVFFNSDLIFPSFPFFTHVILVRGDQRLSGECRAKFAREGLCRRGSLSTLKSHLDFFVDRKKKVPK